jgi:hypothetical protein
MPDNNEKADLLKWFKDFRTNPRGTIIALLLLLLTIAIVGVGTGIGGWFGDRTQDILTAACGWVHLCEQPKEEQEQPGTLVFSTHVPNCLTGRIAYKFRDWTPPPTWENGADRLVICTDASEPVTKADMPEKLQKLVPDCLSVRRDGDTIIIATAVGNPAICRAPYRFDGTTLVNANLEQGWFVCTPGYAHQPSAETFTMASNKVPACEDIVLRRYGFL